ncbi:catalase-peroxidase [Chytriomyces confervae]|uniref:Peroxidase n=1 Tax=Chytriomyces confervae TaxID=246404 RepID=A0A507FHV1_9FUNG|nr:catalase-peroxidase [Chytriomyces confervae]
MIILTLLVQAALLMSAAAQCPFTGDATKKRRGHAHHETKYEQSVSTPTTDYAAIKRDIAAFLTDSHPWWPADHGNYGPLMVTLAWHCSGSHRISDGRGGCDGAGIRRLPEFSWEDNTNLDKAVCLLERVKQKHADISWGDLIILAGNTAIESMGGPKIGFCAGRESEPNKSETEKLGPTKEQDALSPCRLNGNCTIPLGQTKIGLIYVDPEGHLGNPDPSLSAIDVRDSFVRMGFTPIETVALIGGGHTFGKTHGACSTGPGPNPVESPKAPWPGTCGPGPLKGRGNYTYTSGLEGPWTREPTEWSNEYFCNLLSYDWVKTKSPGGKIQWMPTNAEDAPEIRMLTTDLSLLRDKEFRGIVEMFAAEPEKLDQEFAYAWYKLTTTEMGPRSRCINADAPPSQPFQHPLPKPPSNPADADTVIKEIQKILFSKDSDMEGDAMHGTDELYFGAQFVDLAFQCASTYRATDYKGGCNGARIRFWPEKDWPGNEGMDHVLKALEPVKHAFGENVTWSDLIVLAGCASLLEASDGRLDLDTRVGRGDAMNGFQSLEFPYRYYYSSVEIAVLDTIQVLGLSERDAVALSARPRSAVRQKWKGLVGGYSNSTKLSNKYFKLLLSETWVKVPSAKDVYRSKHNRHIHMHAADLVLIKTAKLKKIVIEFAHDEEMFLMHFASGWNYLMLANFPSEVDFEPTPTPTPE